MDIVFYKEYFNMIKHIDRIDDPFDQAGILK